MSYKIIQILSLIPTLLLYGCGANNTNQIATENGFKHQYLQTKKFNLTSYQKIQQANTSVNIYIEGDGKVISNRYRISDDPSPKYATVMQLAALDPNPNVVYLARPCQYSPQDLKSVCEKKYWNTARYSIEVVTAINDAITLIKQQSKAKTINLIGFSGGGALAVLVAAQRDDIASIRTVAGNLDLQIMQKYHDSLPLDESLDPLAVAEKIREIPQIHFIGNKDDIVPVTVAQSFKTHAHLKPEQVQVLKGVSHHKGWIKQWPHLLEYIP